MATTSLWHIKGNLRDLIDYIENPDKTELNSSMQDFVNVFSYDTNPNKTNNIILNDVEEIKKNIKSETNIQHQRFAVSKNKSQRRDLQWER